MTNTISPRLAELHALQPPFIVQFSVCKDFDLGQEGSVETFDGLEFCQVLVNDDSSAVLVTTWESERRYLVAQNRFEDWLKTKYPAWRRERFGHQSQLKSKSQRWWRRIGVWTVFGWAVTLATGLEVLRTDFDAFFAKPEIARADPGEVLDCAAGERFHKELKLRNVAARGSCSVEIGDVRFTRIDDDSHAQSLGLNDGSPEMIPLVMPGADQPIHIRGMLRKPGKYRVAVECIAKAGVLRCNTAPTITATLNVWGALWWGTPVVTESTSQSATVKVPFRVGRSYPNGLDCDVTLSRLPKIAFVNLVSSAVVPRWDRPIFDEASGVSKITFYTQAVGPMQEFAVTLFLESQTPIAEPEWETIAQKLKIGPQERLQEKPS